MKRQLHNQGARFTCSPHHGARQPDPTQRRSRGRSERYTSEAEYEIRAAAAQLGGFPLIVTHAADPAQMNPDTFMKALASQVALVGWAQTGLTR